MTTIVWRVVYDLAGITMRSDWSVHHELIHEYANEFAKDMPGTDVRIESAEVTNVNVIGTKSVQTDPEDFDEQADIVAPYGVEPNYTQSRNERRGDNQ